MIRTFLKDINDEEIFVGDTLIYKGEEYEVVLNPFNLRFAIDNELGQTWLSDVNDSCLKIG
jgi:hypothetical protein